MEEGAVLVEEELFHPEEPSFPLWMAMMLPKEGAFLPGERPVLLEEGLVLVIYQLVPPRQRIDLLKRWKTPSAERLACDEQNLAEELKGLKVVASPFRFVRG